MSGAVSDTFGLQVRVERIKLRLEQKDLAALAAASQADVNPLELDKKPVTTRRKRSPVARIGDLCSQEFLRQHGTT